MCDLWEEISCYFLSEKFSLNSLTTFCPLATSFTHCIFWPKIWKIVKSTKSRNCGIDKVRNNGKILVKIDKTDKNRLIVKKWIRLAKIEGIYKIRDIDNQWVQWKSTKLRNCGIHKIRNNGKMIDKTDENRLIIKKWIRLAEIEDTYR